MKRIVLLLAFGLVCIGAVLYAAPRYVAARNTADRNAAYARMRADNSNPLVLDTVTRAILADADRVQTFQLRNPNRDYDEKDLVPVSPLPMQVDHCEVMHTGPTQRRAFAAALQAALSEAPSPLGTDGQFSPAPVGSPNDFGADVGFRVWRGKVHVDVCVGLDTNFVEITTEAVQSEPLAQTTASLGASRPALLALSKQAFPQDKQLAALE